MKKVIGIGNALVDILIKLESDDLLEELNLPKGSMQLVDKEKSGEVLKRAEKYESQMVAGGSAANTINGLANLKVATAYVGKNGEDFYGDFFIRDMVNTGIKTFVQNGDADTGCAATLISPDSERTFATYLGAAIELTADDLSSDMFKDYDYVHIEGYLVANPDLVEKVAKLAKENNCKVSLDLASYNVVEANLEFLQNIAKNYVDVLFANEEEAKAFTGKEPEEALNEIAEICEIAVVKVGKQGSYIKKGDEVCKVGVIKVVAIDTTGAGDLYAAGFLYGLTKNIPLQQGGEIGALLSGNVVEVIGPKMTEKTWSEIRKRVAEIEG